jgi:hypothetical protein
MPKETYAGECVTILRGMQGNPLWEPMHSKLYGQAFEELGEELARATVRVIVRDCEWRPAIATIYKIANRLSGREIDAEHVYAEIEGAIQKHGDYGVQDPNNPNVYYDGEPSWSSPVVAETVRLLGGWQKVVDWDSFDGALRKAVTTCTESAARRLRDGATHAIPGMARVGKVIEG